MEVGDPGVPTTHAAELVEEAHREEPERSICSFHLDSPRNLCDGCNVFHIVFK